MPAARLRHGGGATAGMAGKMSYECDAELKAPAQVDCAQVEWSELGPDEEDVALGPTLSKILTSSTCCNRIGSRRQVTS